MRSHALERKKTIINLIAELIVFGHLGIRPSGNSPPQKASLIYECVGLIPGIFKIYMCVS
jgi:hypothetical protein